MAVCFDDAAANKHIVKPASCWLFFQQHTFTLQHIALIKGQTIRKVTSQVLRERKCLRSSALSWGLSSPFLNCVATIARDEMMTTANTKGTNNLGSSYVKAEFEAKMLMETKQQWNPVLGGKRSWDWAFYCALHNSWHDRKRPFWNRNICRAS